MINLINLNVLKLLVFFSDSPGRKYLREEIKNKTNFNNLILDESLIKLTYSKFLLRKNKLYFLNLENPETNFFLEKIKKISGNLPLEVAFAMIDFLNKVQKITKIEKIFLFGSYAKLIYHKDSDIDLAIIFNKDKKFEIKKKISAIANKLSKKYKKEIQEHFFTLSDLKNKNDPLIKDLLRNNREII